MAKQSNCDRPGVERFPGHTHTNYLRACLLPSVLVCVGCQDVHTVQKTGTEFTSASLVADVTPQEYGEMLLHRKKDAQILGTFFAAFYALCALILGIRIYVDHRGFFSKAKNLDAIRRVIRP